MGYFLLIFQMKAEEQHQLAHIRRRPQDIVPGVFPNPPGYPSRTHSLDRYFPFQVHSSCSFIPGTVRCTYSAFYLENGPQPQTPILPVFQCHSFKSLSKEDRLPCALYLSHGPHHMLQESTACVPRPYSSLDSKDSTTRPHPGFPASAEDRKELQRAP